MKSLLLIFTVCLISISIFAGFNQSIKNVKEFEETFGVDVSLFIGQVDGIEAGTLYGYCIPSYERRHLFFNAELLNNTIEVDLVLYHEVMHLIIKSNGADIGYNEEILVEMFACLITGHKDPIKGTREVYGSLVDKIDTEAHVKEAIRLTGIVKKDPTMINLFLRSDLPFDALNGAEKRL